MSEEYQRIQQMILDDGTIWDLNKNDKDALRHVLGLVNSLASELADYTGLPVGKMIKRHNVYVRKAEK